MESGNILDNQITSSSESSDTSTAIYARLNTDGAWVAANDDKNQWVKVNMYRQTVITGVKMQGNPSSDKWVTRYKVEFSLDHALWKYIPDENGIEEVIVVNCNLVNLMYYNNVNLYLTFLDKYGRGSVFLNSSVLQNNHVCAKSL